MIDDVMKTIINNKLSRLNPPVLCKVLSVDPLIIKPITDKGDALEIESVKTLGRPVEGPVNELGEITVIDNPLYLEPDDTVLAIFPSWDLSNAVIVGTVK